MLTSFLSPPRMPATLAEAVTYLNTLDSSQIRASLAARGIRNSYGKGQSRCTSCPIALLLTEWTFSPVLVWASTAEPDNGANESYILSPAVREIISALDLELEEV